MTRIPAKVNLQFRRGLHPLRTIWSSEAPKVIPGVYMGRGYECCERGALEHSGRSCRTDGSGVTIGTCWLANLQVGLREMLGVYNGVTLRRCE